jgi:hypothetical protein
MAGLDPAIHDFLKLTAKTWMLGLKQGMTENICIVMAGLDPAIYDFLNLTAKDVDARLRAGHDA